MFPKPATRNPQLATHTLLSTTPSNYWQLTRQRFLKNKRAKWSVRMVVLLMLLALLGDFIAGEIPIYCKLQDRHYFPVFKKQAVDWRLTTWSAPFQNAVWKELDYQRVVYPLIPYSAFSFDRKNQQYKSPFASQQVLSLIHI